MVKGCVRAARCLYPELSAAGSGNRKLKKLTFLVFPLPLPPVHDIQPHITMRPHTSTTAFRPFLRRSAGRRFASTNSESGQRKAQSSDALGSVQKNAERAWEGTKRALGPVGERAGNLFGCEWFYLLLHKFRFSLHPVIILYFILCMAIEPPSANPPPPPAHSIPRSPPLQPLRRSRGPEASLHRRGPPAAHLAGNHPLRVHHALGAREQPGVLAGARAEWGVGEGGGLCC